MMDPKRILMLNYEFPPIGGGSSPVTYEIAKRYVDRGHTVDVVTMAYGNLPRYEKVDGINVYRVPSIRAKKEMCRTHEMLSYVVSAIWFLRNHLKSHQYDINHTHFLVPTGVISLWAKKVFGLDYIVTVHGSDVPGFNTDRFTRLHALTGPLLRLICRGARTITSPSRYLRDLMVDAIDRELVQKIVVIPNGIDPQRFVPLAKERMILATGRLLPRKGFQHLITAVSSADIGYDVHIVGDGPMMARLRRQAGESRTKVIFHGWLDGTSRQYRELLGRAAVYCLPSERENASVSLLEAMSAGCAVITSTAPGCAETVGDAGITVPFGDIQALRTALGGVADDRFARTLGEQARVRIERLFSWDMIVRQYFSQ